jgi:hypothetical protein
VHSSTQFPCRKASKSFKYCHELSSIQVYNQDSSRGEESSVATCDAANSGSVLYDCAIMRMCDAWLESIGKFGLS